MSRTVKVKKPSKEYLALHSMLTPSIRDHVEALAKRDNKSLGETFLLAFYTILPARDRIRIGLTARRKKVALERMLCELLRQDLRRQYTHREMLDLVRHAERIRERTTLKRAG